jgi:hypothetical protein
MNENIHPEFSTTELEERLETDPLLISNLLDMGETASSWCWCNGCNSNCTENH